MGVVRAPQGEVFRGACAHEGITAASVSAPAPASTASTHLGNVTPSSMGAIRTPAGVVLRGAGIMVESGGIQASATNFAARSLQAIAVARSALLPTLQYPSRTWR